MFVSRLRSFTFVEDILSSSKGALCSLSEAVLRLFEGIVRSSEGILRSSYDVLRYARLRTFCGRCLTASYVRRERLSSFVAALGWSENPLRMYVLPYYWPANALPIWAPCGSLVFICRSVNPHEGVCH